MNNQLFGKTELVDRDELYKIDYDGFAREVLGLKPQNNEDLVLVTQKSGVVIANQSSKKSDKGSPAGKKKKGSKGRKEKEVNAWDNIESKTYENHERLSQLVEFLLLENPDVPEDIKKLTIEERFLKEELLAPFEQFGLEFPSFNPSILREDMIRIVTKAFNLR